MTNITQAYKRRYPGSNNFTWANLTEGKLRALYRLTNEAAKNGDALAHDCAHDLYNFFYEEGMAESMDKVA